MVVGGDVVSLLLLIDAVFSRNDVFRLSALDEDETAKVPVDMDFVDLLTDRGCVVDEKAATAVTSKSSAKLFENFRVIIFA